MLHFGRSLFLVAAVFLSVAAESAPLASAFTYQGRLIQGGSAANGQYDFTFNLFDAPSAGTQLGPIVTNTSVLVSNGLFTATLDFGAGIFNGDPRWLEVSVRTGTESFTALTPRQSLTAAPYSITAGNLAGQVTVSQLPANVSRLDANQTFSASNIFSGPVAFTTPIRGDGSALTNLLSTALTRPMTTANPLGTNLVVDFASDAVQLTLSSNVSFALSTNRVVLGRYAECVWYLQCGLTNRLLWFNTSWVPLGTLATNNPILLASNKLVTVAFSVRGPDETNVCYAIVRQE